MQEGDINGAFADFSMAIKLKPDYAEAYNERGLAMGAMVKNGGNIESYLASAITDYTTAIQIKPEFASAYYNRGVAMQAKENWQNAKVDFDKVVELKPDIALLASSVRQSFCSVDFPDSIRAALVRIFSSTRCHLFVTRP
jgi:tetratricopeptide (TPR) repeat protein